MRRRGERAATKSCKPELNHRGTEAQRRNSRNREKHGAILQMSFSARSDVIA